jgi:hypothetical protein
MEIFDDQYARGNKRFVERFIASNGANEVLVEEVQKLQQTHITMPPTWAKNRHPATMYYKWLINVDCS